MTTPSELRGLSGDDHRAAVERIMQKQRDLAYAAARRLSGDPAKHDAALPAQPQGDKP